MIEQQAIVVSCEGEYAEVEAQRQSTCGGCEAKGVCGTSALAKALGAKAVSMRVRNGIQARPGEVVVVGLAPGILNRASIAAYLVPVLALIFGGAFGDRLGGQLGLNPTEPLSIFFGLLGLLLALWWLRRFSSGKDVDGRYQPVILRRAVEPSIPVDLH